jgi:DNA polymerase
VTHVTIDFETKSEADLKKVGTWVYSQDPTTEVICLCWAVDDGPVYDWAPARSAVPLSRLTELAYDPDVIFEAHNVAFEISIWRNVMVRRYGWPDIPNHRWRDSMAVASYYALPAGLDKLARVLGFGEKDPAGGRLISKYSKLHLKTAKRVIPPADLDLFVAYCRKDVELERAVSNFLGPLPKRELEVFHMDLEINLRGLALDQSGIDAATAVVEKRAEELNAEFVKLTGVKPTQRDKVLAWFRSKGLDLPDMKAETLEEAAEEIDETLPTDVLRALKIRLQVNKASTKKLDAMSRQRDAAGRARFQCRYHGAQTGRWTGTGFQPLNLNRGIEKMDPHQLVRDIGYGDPRYLDMLYGDAMDAVAKATRHWIQAAPGHRIMAGDFVSIEAVVLACLAGEDWKVDAFRRGVKIYEAMAEKIYNLPPGTVTKETHPLERQDGKTGELAFGYQGGLKAWLNFDSSGRHSDERILEICKAWRQAHPAITRFWRRLNEEAIDAVEHPGKETGYREIGFKVVDDWLSMILPDGKRIWYWNPEVRVKMPSWHKPAEDERCASGECDHEPIPQLTYMAQKFGKWARVSTYGGKLCENATQATARQLLVPAMLRLRAAGYPIVLSVYDEIVAEPEDGFGSVEEFEEILKGCPGDWAKGWPIGVDCWEGTRYKK